jgi:transcriptional regulator with XRE-family HTH domain
MSSPSIRKAFGTRIRELRLATGMTQEAFADHCGFARTYMSRVETGGANPSLDAIKVFADALSIDLSALFEGL